MSARLPPQPCAALMSVWEALPPAQHAQHRCGTHRRCAAQGQWRGGRESGGTAENEGLSCRRWVHVPSLGVQLSQACGSSLQALVKVGGAAGAWRSWADTTPCPMQTPCSRDRSLSCLPCPAVRAPTAALAGCGGETLSHQLTCVVSVRQCNCLCN